MEEFDGNIVYGQVDSEDRITSIISNEFIDDPTGWIEIDRGYGDRYKLARSNYFPTPLQNDYGVCLYKLVNGHPESRTAEEIEADMPEDGSPFDFVAGNIESRVTALEHDTDVLAEAVNILLGEYD